LAIALLSPRVFVLFCFCFFNFFNVKLNILLLITKVNITYNSICKFSLYLDKFFKVMARKDRKMAHLANMNDTFLSSRAIESGLIISKLNVLP